MRWLFTEAVSAGKDEMDYHFVADDSEHLVLEYWASIDRVYYRVAGAQQIFNATPAMRGAVYGVRAFLALGGEGEFAVEDLL